MRHCYQVKNDQLRKILNALRLKQRRLCLWHYCTQSYTVLIVLKKG